MNEQLFEIPESFLVKLFDLTGTQSGGNKGFVLCYVNSKGDPIIISKTENTCTSIALHSALGEWIQDN